MMATEANPCVQAASTGKAVAKRLVTKMADFGLARFEMSPRRYAPIFVACLVTD